MFAHQKQQREAVIRTSLVDHLKESVQSLLQKPGGGGVPRLSSNSLQGPILGHTENTNVLCSVLEAIFIHGLKDSMGDKLSSMFLGDLDRMPVPNFWPVVMVISHRDLMEQVSALSFIMNDVGKSRAWLRLALNQGQLISYLSVLASDIHTLKDYYKGTALLRDLEKCDIILRVLNPLNGINFKLATNAAILNTWSQSPLILSGLWFPANYEQSMAPVMSATDVASTFYEDHVDHSFGIPIPQTPLSDQMFDFIINSTPDSNFILENEESKYQDVIKPEEQKNKIKKTILKSPPAYKKKRKSSKTEESNTQLNVEERSEKLEERSNSLEEISSIEDICMSPRSPDLIYSSPEADHRKLTRVSSVSSETTSSLNNSFINDADRYNALLEDWQTFNQSLNLPDFLISNAQGNIEDDEAEHDKNSVTSCDDFEVVSTPKLPSDEEMQSNFVYLTTIQKEIGLDAQKYQCNTTTCGMSIGMLYGKPRLCYYDARYHCCECHKGHERRIPGRILQNWDFRNYPVCVQHEQWLDCVANYPFIDIRMVNPKVYKHFIVMSELQSLRQQLHFIQAYLFTCNNKVNNGEQELRKHVWPREYMYEHVHLYSINDLYMAFINKLVPIVSEAVSKGKVHIMRCPLCCPRGFICEICKDKHIIYPFQLQETYTCAKCNGVFHKLCMKRVDQCPKCKRIQLRNARSSAGNSEES